MRYLCYHTAAVYINLINGDTMLCMKMPYPKLEYCYGNIYYHTVHTKHIKPHLVSLYINLHVALCSNRGTKRQAISCLSFTVHLLKITT